MALRGETMAESILRRETAVVEIHCPRLCQTTTVARARKQAEPERKTAQRGSQHQRQLALKKKKDRMAKRKKKENIKERASIPEQT